MSDRRSFVEAGPPTRLGPRPAAPPVRTGWNGTGATPSRTHLGDLADVDSPPVETPTAPAVLVRGADGVYRPVPLGDVARRGSVVHYVADAAVPTGAEAGDYVTVISGAGAGIYEVQEDS